MPNNPLQALKGAQKIYASDADKRASAQREWRERNPLISKIGDFLTGGATDPDAKMGPTDVLAAGLPFAGIMKGPVYHGTQKVFEKFNPLKNDKTDVLGWMTHFAEDPHYANTYASGSSKGSNYIPLEAKHVDEHIPNYFDENIGDYRRVAPHVIPAKIDAKNVLDLVDPNADDLSHALAALPEFERKRHIVNWKDSRRDPENYYSNQLKESNHYKDYNIPKEEVPARFLAERLRLDENTFPKTQFDAIRYRDNSNKSWAVPKDTGIRSAYGAPLTKNTNPLKVLRTDKSYGGTLEVRPDRWENTPLNLPEVPYPEKMKENMLKTPNNIKYTTQDIDNMYYNNSISADEKNYLYTHNLHNPLKGNK